MTTVLFAGGGTGGHLMPALAVADATRARHPDWRMVFAGAQRGIEAQVLPARGLPHQLLPLEPIYRQQWWKNLRWPFLLPGLIRRIDRLLDQERPDAVVGTGGYVSGPVVWRAARRGIPTAVLDLDVLPGIATRWLAGAVSQIWLATPEARQGLPARTREKAQITGAPIVPPDHARRLPALARFGLDPEAPTLVVTGGSQGSRAINRLLATWIDGGGLGHWQLIWATGKATFDEFASYHRPPRVHVLPFIDPMADAWAVADLCVARAGMMTIAELCAWGIPGLLIPLPTAAADHQTHNARAMDEAGAARMLAQPGLTSDQLGRALGELQHDPLRRATLGEHARLRGRPDAASDLATRVAGLVQGGRG